MIVEFTLNAQARMLERGITEADVRAAVQSPDTLGPCLDKCWHARKQLEARKLEVIFVREPAQVRIVTAYWQEQAA